MAQQTVRVATVNVNGVRAAFRKGMGAWLEDRGVDVLALQEVRAATSDLEELLGAEWDVLHDPATVKGRAGVAIASRGKAEIHRVTIGDEDFDTAGRWLEADYAIGGEILTVVSAYVHSGEAGTPKQDDKMRFLEAFERRMPELTAHNPLSLIVGDLNVAHRSLDIKNWKGNLKNSGFLPEERAFWDRFVGAEDAADYNAGGGLGWVDVGRRAAGEVQGPYTWWSWRGQTFANDAGWRIDYHLASPALAERVEQVAVDRAATRDERWSDHTPVVVDYRIGA
ncbi:exodeoxyribonuclease III [Amnibacterium setariae]|uniref:Exodeoxyribonuclease III n=1 Tax=Amnibacterium setariae TaxID=2306585 RepID=A0A3A1TS76_9MICO|nr:exodeoxyribonuclease III [Amnibacterium setariae]RIX26545.1 exodeoxyribonuclease III [Amnibacterium setariae]